ncbi:MAG: EamA family transporter [Clostridia bacterium]|nr:EamA family transporter [Clostridia bacterium]
MWNLLWPIMTVVAANCLYNICTKQTPGDVNAFASLSVTYLIASALSVAAFFLSHAHKSYLQEISRLNWTSIALGLSIVALEFGYISIYRAGWKVSLGSLVANISLACILLFVGLLFYKETLSPKQLLGMAVCVVGLILLGE